jgi:hypothetical protein
MRKARDAKIAVPPSAMVVESAQHTQHDVSLFRGREKGDGAARPARPWSAIVIPWARINHGRPFPYCLA